MLFVVRKAGLVSMEKQAKSEGIVFCEGKLVSSPIPEVFADGVRMACARESKLALAQSHCRSCVVPFPWLVLT